MYPEDIETNTGGTPEPAPPQPINERPTDGPGSGRSELRKQLESGFEKARRDEKRDERREPARRDHETGKFTSRAREEGLVEETPVPAEGEREAAPATEGQQGEQQYTAPEGWTREAKAEWANLPPTVQAAVAKRETDMAKGVEDLKGKYSEIDKALAPRLDLIKRHNQTPAAAINQLFAWFEALSANPTVSFPALAESFKFDLRSIPGLIPEQTQQPPAQQPGQQPQPQEEMPPYVRELQQKLAALEQGVHNQFGQLSQSFQQEQWNKLNSILNNWSKDKPYFNEVRHTMGQLINAGAVAPMANGEADLDKAYDMALWALPEIRARVLADQQKAADDARKAKEATERKAQQEAADKARRANGGSLAQSAPGNVVPGKKPSKGKSVRESIMEAREELLER